MASLLDRLKSAGRTAQQFNAGLFRGIAGAGENLGRFVLPKKIEGRVFGNVAPSERFVNRYVPAPATRSQDIARKVGSGAATVVREGAPLVVGGGAYKAIQGIGKARKIGKLGNLARLVAAQTASGAVAGASGEALRTGDPKRVLRSARDFAIQDAAITPLTAIPNITKTPLLRALPRVGASALAGFNAARVSGQDQTTGALIGALGGVVGPGGARTAIPRSFEKGTVFRNIEDVVPTRNKPNERRVAEYMKRLTSLNPGKIGDPLVVIPSKSTGQLVVQNRPGVNGDDVLEAYKRIGYNKLPTKPTKDGISLFSGPGSIFKKLDDKYAGSVPNKVLEGGTTDPVQQYIKQQVKLQNDAKKQGNGLMAKAGNFLGTLKKTFEDSQAPIEDILAQAQKQGGYEVLPSKNISNNIDRALRAQTLAGQFTRDTGFERVIRDVDDLDALNQYLIAKQATRVSELGLETGRDAAKDRQLITALAEKYEPYAAQVRQHNEKLLDYLVDSGITSREMADELLEKYPDYVPLNRVFSPEELENMPSGTRPRGIASVGSQNVIQRLKGSKREIENPIESILQKTAQAFELGERNKAARQLADYKDLPGNPFGIVPIRTAEDVNKRIDIFSKAKDLSPIQSLLERTLSTQKRWARKLNSELTKLNREGLYKSLKQSFEAEDVQVGSGIKVKATPSQVLKTKPQKDEVIDVLTKKEPIDAPEFEEQMYNVYQELDAAEAGGRTRILDENSEAKIISWASGFPDWITSPDLRSKKLVNEVLQSMDNGTVPKSPKARELYDVVEAEIRRRAGDTVSGAQQARRGEPTTQELTATFSASPFASIRLKDFPATPSKRQLKTLLGNLVNLPRREIELIKKKIATRENKLGMVLDQVATASDALEAIKAQRSALIDQGNSLKDGVLSQGTARITVFRDGVKEVYETLPEVADAAKNLSKEQMNIFGKMLSLPTRVLRLGATGINLPFIASNVVKDQVFSFINSDKALSTSIANPPVFLRSLMAVIKQDDLYDEWLRSGAAITSFDVGRETVKPTVQRIRAGRNAASKIAYTVTKPEELLRAIENIVGKSEELTRVQQFLGTKRALQSEGRAAADVTALAAKASRENTANFARRGDWGQWLNGLIPYLNAGIQGARSLRRSFATRPIQTATKVGITVLAPMAYTTISNLSDEKRRAAYEDIPDYEKENNFIIIPPNPTKDDQGNWNVIKIPLTPGVSNLASILRRQIESLYGFDQQGFMQVAGDLLEASTSVNPVESDKMLSKFLPQAVKPVVESSTNTNLFTGLPIVPRNLENLPNEYQVKPGTSGTSRLLGKFFGASPLKTENTVKSSLGGLGSQLLNASDRVLAKTGVIPESQIGGKGVLEQAAGRFTKARGGDEKGSSFDRLNELEAQEDVKGIQSKEQAQQLYDRIGNLPKADRVNELNRLKQSGQLTKETYDKYVEIRKDAEQGLDSFDRSLKRADTDARAQIIYENIKDLPKEDRVKKLKEYKKKKILTKDTYEKYLKLKNSANVQ